MAPKKRKRKQGGLFATIFRILAVSAFAVLLGYIAGQVGIRIVTGSLGVSTQVRKEAPPSQSTAPKDTTSAKQSQEAAPVKNAAKPAPAPAQKTSSAPKQSTTSPAPVSQPTPQARPVASSHTANIEPEAVPAMAAPYPAKATPTPAAAPVSSGQLWKVRVGRYATRETAEEELARVRLYVPEAFLTKDGNYFRIQAGAFGSEAKAEALAQQLARYDLTAEIVPPAQ